MRRLRRSSSPFHRRLISDMVTAALRAGKHVLCEKPFGVDAGQAARMWERLARATGSAWSTICFGWLRSGFD